MRLSRSIAPVLATAAALTVLSYEAVSHVRGGNGGTRTSAEAREEKREPFGSECRIQVAGSAVTAHCHNPYATPDRVRLHVECARWWDIDTDGPPAVAGPAETVRLTGRCWKEVGSAWVSHEK